MHRSLLITLLVGLFGCASEGNPIEVTESSDSTHAPPQENENAYDPIATLPDTAQVASHLTPEQLELGGPLVDSIGIVLAPIPAGEYLMGSSDTDQAGLPMERPQHLVRITKPFYLGVCEVTRAQYEQVLDARPWQLIDVGEWLEQGQQPESKLLAATSVSYHNAVEFCSRLSEIEGAEYRLPSEAEWEYACRAGTTTAFSFGDDLSELDRHAWCYGYTNGSEGRVHAVGQKEANPWGLYDMHGNVEEWCADWYALKYEGESVNDPTGPAEGDEVVRLDESGEEVVSGRARVMRGGSFAMYLDPSCLRSAFRAGYFPDGRRSTFGFRVVREYVESE
ncbi:MAG: formylglycine-generating enzyme family protein [Planctomycetota bacterium]|nr:MAG: formylglycine-generating enzyme family protein [Planctomycetota bacterium]REK30700.1 MAG: formylglycine-generating enzyme family protein [Planctomycetota bacterium]REK33075.1 MAG: formylglycine-generating enzyme family protein [Planctomycetota bacterium]